MDSQITVIIPTSVLPSHPSTRIIDETIASIRHHLPNSEIIMQIDGLRDEQQDRKADYDEYKTQILWKCLHEYTNVLPMLFDDLHHQSGMMRKTIGEVRTPLILYVEGDCPLITDQSIDWGRCVNFIMNGEANTIRFHHENVIPDEHSSLMLGDKNGFMRTVQWSQRPHLSTVQYYKDIVLPVLPDANFIEDTFHGVVLNDYDNNKMLGWYKHRLWIYYPKKNIQRSYTTDGRQAGLKYTSDRAGGGGAGGLIYNSSYSIGSNTRIVVTVGAGGTAWCAPGACQYPAGGSNTSIIIDGSTTVIALGGGVGGTVYNGDAQGRPGGSGGGGSHFNGGFPGGSATQPASSSGGFGCCGGAVWPNLHGGG